MTFLVRINAADPVKVQAKSANAAVDAARALCTEPGEYAIEIRTEDGEPVSEFGHLIKGEEAAEESAPAKGEEVAP